MALIGAPVALVISASPASAADITVACPGTTNGTTFTLSNDCNTTEPLTVPDGFTINGANHTINASDTAANQWNGGIVTNAGASMNIRNLTVSGPANGFVVSTLANNVVYGIFFNDAGGTVDNVLVTHIWQQQNPNSPANQTGRAIRAEGGAHTVTITNTTVTDYQKSGFEARGSITMNVSQSTAGPPNTTELHGFIAQNGVTYVGPATGTLAHNTIHGSGAQTTGWPSDSGRRHRRAPVWCLGVTVNDNTITGAGTNVGISVSAGATGQHHQLQPGQPDRTRCPRCTDRHRDRGGSGLVGDAGLQHLHGIGWNQNIDGAIQIACTPLPDGAECAAYSAPAPTVDGTGTKPFAWTLASGKLPPGLSLAPQTGEITGTPPAGSAGTYKFTLHVATADQLTATSDQTIVIAPGCASPTPTPSPSATATAAPTATAQPTAAPTAVDAGLSSTSADGQQPPTVPMALMLLAAGLVLTVATVAGLRRRPRRH